MASYNKTMYHSSSSGSKKNYERTEPESHRMAKMFYFLSSSSSFTSSSALTSPSLSHNFEVSRGSSNHSLNNYGFICNATFFTCMHAHKLLSSKT